MKPVTLIDNLNIIKDMVSSSTLFIVLLAISCFAIMFISRTTRINAKIKSKIYIGVYLVAVISLIALYYKSLSTMFDYMMNNLFVIFCFPNLACYLASLIVLNVVLWITTLNGKEDTITKVVNSSVFVILHYLLILLLITANKEKLDLFSQNSIYGNDKEVAIIEISSMIFILWITFTIIYKLVRTVIYKRKGMELNQVVVYTSEPDIVEEKEEKIRMVEAPAFIRRGYTPKPAIAPTITKAEPVIIPLDKPNTIEVEAKVEEEPKVIKTKEQLAYEEALTLEDYKLLLNLLKAEKEKMKERTRDVVIKDDRKRERNIESRLGELQDLYKSVS